MAVINVACGILEGMHSHLRYVLQYYQVKGFYQF